jgi:hypothetical protein
MQARTLAIMIELLELKNAFVFQLREKRKNPALIMMYSFIDICAALVNDGKEDNSAIFQSCIKEHAIMDRKPFTSYDLWAARSSLLHSFSPLGRHHKPEKGAKPIFYYAWNDSREELETVLRAKGYTDVILLEIEAIQWAAIDILNSIYRHIDSTPGFEARLLRNAEHFLFDLQAFKLEDELSMMQRLAEENRPTEQPPGE